MDKNRGYVGWSRSVRAHKAKREGKRPASRLAKELQEHFPGVTAADIRAAIDPCEWHHTSKECNATDYFDPRELLPDHEGNQCAEETPCGDCEECSRREEAVDNAANLRHQIAQRKAFASLVRKHGDGKTVPIYLDDGALWYKTGDQRDLGRVLVSLNCGGYPRDGSKVGEKLEQEELAKIGL